MGKVVANAVGNPDMYPFYGAPTVILVSIVVGEGPMSNVNYSNAATIVQNMALAATELGVGDCHIWGAVSVLSASAEVNAELKVPEGMVPCCAIALGKTNEKYEIRNTSENRIKTAFIR